jgi:hypothetical protein
MGDGLVNSVLRSIFVSQDMSVEHLLITQTICTGESLIQYTSISLPTFEIQPLAFTVCC